MPLVPPWVVPAVRYAYALAMVAAFAEAISPSTVGICRTPQIMIPLVACHLLLDPVPWEVVCSCAVALATTWTQALFASPRVKGNAVVRLSSRVQLMQLFAREMACYLAVRYQLAPARLARATEAL